MMRKLDTSKLFPIIFSLERVPSFVPDNALCDTFAPGLTIVFAVEAEAGRTFITEDNIQALGLQRYELLLTALNNLRERLSKVERMGRGPTYLLKANGRDEACLLLLDQFWDGMAKEVEGELLVAVPAQACLVFTGSRAKAGLTMLKAAIKALAGSGDSRLSDRIYVRRNGGWEEYGADAALA